MATYQDSDFAHDISAERLKRSRPFDADDAESADIRVRKRAVRSTPERPEKDSGPYRVSSSLRESHDSVPADEDDTEYDDDDCSMHDDNITNQTPTETLEAEQSSVNQGNVCFGTIVDVEAAFLEDNESNHSHPSRLSVHSDAGHCYDICSYKDCYCLQLSDSRKFAVVHSRTAGALKTLRDLPSIRFEAIIPGEGIETLGQQHRKGKKAVFPISINIYGSEKAIEEVGKRLSKARTYLQHPTTLSVGVPYNNPHYYDIPGVAEAGCRDFSQTSGREEQQAPDLDVTKIFEEVDYSRQLPSQNADWHIKTPLLKHQKEALNFILRKESGLIDDDLSLWTTEDSDYGCLSYEHAILQSKRSTKPEPSRGGILADDMGLGKTLTMISAIAMSLNEARAFKCSPNSIRADNGPQIRRRTSSTLVIAPSSTLLDGWKDQIQIHVAPGQLSVYKYHGIGKNINLESLVGYDVITTTYATIASEVAKKSSLLQQIVWFRVVLDEAHAVRHQATQQFRAVFSLHAERRWCLTGTPIQNRMEDLGSLVRILRTDLFDSNATFRTYISEPLLTNPETGGRNLRLLLRSMCLRRTRVLLNLPNAEDKTVTLSLSIDERSVYSQIIEDTKKQIDAYVSSRSINKAYNGVFLAILRLRLLCNHGVQRFPDSRLELRGDCVESEHVQVEGGKLTCPFCSCEISISDEFRNSSHGKPLDNGYRILCPACLLSSEIDGTTDQRKPEKQRAIGNRPVQQKVSTKTNVHLPDRGYQTLPGSLRPKPLSLGHSSKLSALVSNLEENMLGNKSIVFSCFKRTLYLLELLLAKTKMQYARIDGATPTTERNRIIKRFQEHPDSNLLLMTTGTGAVGLNLTAANRVYLFEPQWNPAIEAQAIGRALRLGQTRTVTIIRYVMEKTIEESIQSRQVMKLQLAELTLEKKDGDEQTMSQRLKDLRSLLHKY